MLPNSTPHQGYFRDLFQEQALHCIPTIYSNETLYSWCARYHRISGSISATATSQRLFGSKTAGFVVDFPGRLEYFSKVTASILGSPCQLIRDHTLYSLYAAFRPPLTMAKVETMMLGNSVERLKFILGLPSSRASTSHPLKFCISCAREETKNHGIASWWREHQWPTVWVCPKHHRPLKYLYSPEDRHRLTSWVTPDCLQDSAFLSPPKLKDAELIGLERLRLLTAELTKTDDFLRPEIMRLIFTKKLADHSWIKRNGTLDWPAIQNEYIKRHGNLEALPGFDFIQSIRSDDYGSLSTMLRGSNRIQHPTKYILLINLLFDIAEDFVEQYAAHSSDEFSNQHTHQIKRANITAVHSALKILVTEKRNSLNQAAKTLEIPIERVISWARSNNIQYKKRPHKTKPEFIAKLSELIDQGKSRAFMSQTLGVSQKWITSHLAKNPNQRTKWRSANLTAETNNRRSELLKILEENPGANQKIIRSIPKNPFQWLKKNDPDWLKNAFSLLD